MRDYTNVKKKSKDDDKTACYYYSLQQLLLDPDSQQLLKHQLGQRLLDWIEDEYRRILADKEENNL